MNEFDYQRTIIAYHGCDEQVVRAVLQKRGRLKSSENRFDWLGKGIYFWEHGPQRAWDWARQRAADRPEKIQKPAVVGAVLHLGKCFDLLDVANTGLLAKLYPGFAKAQRKAGREMPANRSAKGGDAGDLLLRYLDCAMINWTMDILEADGLSFDTVRCAFSEGEAAFPGSKIYRKSHVQIAVRNPAVILGYFLPAVDFRTKNAD